jgi:hypothetical protein
MILGLYDLGAVALVAGVVAYYIRTVDTIAQRKLQVAMMWRDAAQDVVAKLHQTYADTVSAKRNTGQSVMQSLNMLVGFLSKTWVAWLASQQAPAVPAAREDPAVPEAPAAPNLAPRAIPESIIAMLDKYSEQDAEGPPSPKDLDTDEKSDEE